MSTFLAQRTATGWLAVIGTLPTPPKVNIAPKASFTSTVKDLAVQVNGSASSDVDGTVVSWAWRFGDGSTATGVTASHSYAKAGTYVVTLTVTDDDGATDVATQSVSVTAPVTPPVGYTGDTGLNPDTNGSQPSGAGLVPWASTSGATDLARFRSTGSGNKVALPVGTIDVRTFTTLSYEKITTSGGIVGAGSSRSVIREVQDSAPSGAASNMLRFDAGNVLLQDFTMQGTKQANRGSYTGLMIGGGTVTGRRVKLKNSNPGYQAFPPGETFAINELGTTGALWEDVEIAAEAISGQQAGASLFGMNSCTGTHRYTRCYAHGGNYSGAWAIWQNVGDVIIDDPVVDNCRCWWNIERCTGSVTINRPRIGTLKSATSGWGSVGGTGSPQSPFAIVCETDATWHNAHTGGFLLKIVDPRNMDGTPYTGQKLVINYIKGNDGTPNLYGRNNFKGYSASGADISSTLFTYGGGAASNGGI